MALIKCKMCGGDLKITEGLTVAECEYCGSRQTIPSADNEKKMTLFTRAARLLRGCEFDKAAGLFESIVADFPEEAEAYWGLVLCKYGIEYVDDPATGKKVPTCHRSSFDSVLDDANFEQACENTDAVARRIYRDEARQIEELRKRIIEVSGREEPYDVFISYKETDENGQRTLDSVIAQDIYDELSGKGYRVFFSRISLEDKLGVEYEPYIFAALNSAKLMLVVGTDYEHFDAVWVKNEWSRFLKLIASGEKKVLIPVFKNMDAYDMPKEFAKLAAQDMGKLGAMQDLVRGVEKILGGKKEEPKEEKRETVIVQQGGGPNVQAMIDRGSMALEDGKWEDAKSFFNRALDMDAKCAEAYLGLFLMEKECGDTKAYIRNTLDNTRFASTDKREACPKDTERIQRAVQENTVPHYLDKQLEQLFALFDRNFDSKLKSREAQLNTVKGTLIQNKNYSRACKFAAGATLENIKSAENELFAELQRRIDEARAEDEKSIARVKKEYAQHLDKAEAEAKHLRELAEAKRESDYNEACELAEKAETESDFFFAAELFGAEKLGAYKDCAQKAAYLKQKSQDIRDELLAKKAAEKARLEEELRRIAAEATEKAERKRIEDEKEAERRCLAEEAERKRLAAKKKKTVILLSILALLTVAAVLIYTMVIVPGNEYKAAEELLAAEKYEEAIAAFEALENFKDSHARVDEAVEARNARDYAAAEELLAAGKYDEAISVFKALGTYSDSTQRVDEVEEKRNARDYAAAEVLLASGKIDGPDGAIAAFKALGTYRDSQARVNEAYMAWDYAYAEKLLSEGKYADAGMMFARLRDYKDASDRSFNAWAKAGLCESLSAELEHSVGVKSDGTVVAVGKNDYGQCDVSDWTDIVSVSAGGFHTVGLKSDRTAVAVGSDNVRECNVSGWSEIVAISAGHGHTVGLKADGTVVATGSDHKGQCNVGDWTDIVAISAGYDHTIGVKSDGTVVACGDNDEGQCDVSAWTDIAAISAGSVHTVGLKADGTVVATGSNLRGQCRVDNWTDIIAVSAGRIYTVGLKADGTVVAVGDNSHGQCNVSDWTDIVAISAGGTNIAGYYTVGLKSDATVVAVGQNNYGRCNVSGWTDIRVPEV